MIRMHGFRELRVDQEVAFEWGHAQQDSYSFRAFAVWSPGEAPHDAEVTNTADPSAVSSSLTIEWDHDRDA